jgi:cyanophycinase-like exopeptidase
VIFNCCLFSRLLNSSASFYTFAKTFSMKIFISALCMAVLLVMSGCSRIDEGFGTDQIKPISLGSSGGAVKGSKTITGDPADVSRTTTGGTCLMGGGTDVDAAFRWMIDKSGGGDFVVIRTDNSMGYNDYIYAMGGVNSVETIIIAKATDANNTTIENKIRSAEALFIAGGDQANYVNLWKNTKVENAINYLISEKHAPSAGCAILGTSYFAALKGSVTSAEAMADPYNPLVSLGHDDFINIPVLQNTITDQHFTQRGREGRLVTFMARMYKDKGKNPRGIAADEQTAVCVDESGTAIVFGLNNAFFLKKTIDGPETCISGKPLTWYRDSRAVKVYKIKGSATGNGSFNLTDFATASGGTWSYFYVNTGTFGMSY